METVESRADYLTSHQVRPSLQRLAVLDYLHTHKTHPTVDEVFDALAPQIPTLSKTTVYNTLALFLQAGLVQELTINGNMNRYDGDTHPHAHFLCQKCGKVFDVNYPSFSTQTELVPSGFQLESVHVYYKGYCPECNTIIK